MEAPADPAARETCSLANLIQSRADPLDVLEQDAAHALYPLGGFGIEFRRVLPHPPQFFGAMMRQMSGADRAVQGIAHAITVMLRQARPLLLEIGHYIPVRPMPEPGAIDEPILHLPVRNAQARVG